MTPVDPCHAPLLYRREDAHCHELAHLLNFPCDFVNSGVCMAMHVSSARTTAMRKPKAPEANRARILAAATTEFASRGFKGASMDAIAARTDTTRALINYYFGSKERFYLAVLEHVYAEIRAAEINLDLDHLPPVEAIRRIVEFTYNYYLEHEGFVRLVVAENQARGRHLKKSQAMRTAQPADRRDAWRASSRAGQADGSFRADVDPVDVHKSIAALGMFNVTNQYTFGAIFQREMGAQGRRRRTPRHGGGHDSQLARARVNVLAVVAICIEEEVMKFKFDRRTALKAGAALAASPVIPAWAQGKPTLRFAAVFSDKDIRADMMQSVRQGGRGRLQGRDVPRRIAVQAGHRARRTAARQPRNGQHRAAGHLQAGSRLVDPDVGVPVPRRRTT